MTFWLGPVGLALGNPSFSWDADPQPDGSRDAVIAGMAEWWQAQQLSELVANPARRATIGKATGVLEYFWAGDEMLRPFRGWYLFSKLNLRAEQPHSLGGISAMVPFSLSATYLGDQRQPVVSRSARARDNAFDLDGQALVVNPFWGEDADGEPFLIDPGGTFFTREYDPTSPHDGTRLTPTDGARLLGMNGGALNDLARVVLVDLEGATDYDGQTVPRWVTDRGGDCRAFDRREGREVFGPSHPLVVPTDLVITNGLVRIWVGPRGLPPYVQVQALAGGEWREVGYVHLAVPTSRSVVLASARLTRVTPEAVSVALSVRGQGDVTVTLRRGERMLQLEHGTTGPARVLAGRHVRWAGVPACSRLGSAANGTGKFGKGLDSGRDNATWADPIAVWADPNYSWTGQWVGNPDLRLRWPPNVKRAWTKCWWYRPARAVADLNGAGLLSIFDDAGDLVGRILLDQADNRFKFTVGATTVQSSVQTFAASADVFVCLRFSDELGMALSIKAGAGALEHIANAAALDPGTTGTYDDIFFGTSDGAAGSGSAGDDVAGGVRWADGVQDNFLLFDAYLTNAEVADLAEATSRLDGLPSPESHLVWHFPGDPRPVPLRSALDTGRLFEATSEDGATRSPDEWGLTKGLAVLSADAVALDGFEIAALSECFEIAAFLATTATGDDLEDHHLQFAAASEQEVRVR